jgi:hypothetical protein
LYEILGSHGGEDVDVLVFWVVAPSKRWHLSSSPHGVATQNNIIDSPVDCVNGSLEVFFFFLGGGGFTG